MRANEGNETRRAEAGFTLVEALVAIVVLIFGLMAVTNLLLVAASSNTVANQGTLAVATASEVLDFLKVTSYDVLDNTPGGTPFSSNDGGKECSDVTLVPTDWHCTTSTPGVGSVHAHWFITATADPRLLYIRVQAEGTGALAAARSRSEFTTFRSCTDTGIGCPAAP